ncbi:AAA family ATPase [Streptomyces globisporus]|uniref:ATP-dependent nuclease n=1 Tax=Streptomyces globisporus TaxID=1908 RepID=UPI003867997E|nr:AAA family ATPase [Streptomyces globisporus]
MDVEIPADLSGGDSSQFSVSISSIRLQNGYELKPPSAGVTAVVGGNNVGKSTLLKQIANLAARDVSGIQQPERWQLVTDLKFQLDGTARDCTAWLAEHETTYSMNGILWFGSREFNNMHELHVRKIFEESSGLDKLSGLSNAFTLHADPWQRIDAISPKELRENIDIPARTPMHRLQDSLPMLTELRDICREVFRVDITLDALARMIQLRVGTVATPPPPVDAVTSEYRNELASLPPLLEQGDGMKSLIGLVLPLVTAAHPIVLIDEPEAFLHPPQAGALGRILGDLARKRKIQVILATHDKNLLTGLLSSGAEVSVVRLDRDLAGKSHAHQLAVPDVRELWGDPLLKYTNVLDSLFHRLTIIAEADQDCRFYAAALGEYEPKHEIAIPPSDVLFIPSYGKSAMHKLVGILRAIHVPVVAVPDIDILNDEVNISRLVEAYGVGWAGLRSDYRVATQSFREVRTPTTIGDVLKAMQSVFSGREAEKYTKDNKREVISHLRAQDSPWALLKRFGQTAFDGQAAVAGQRLLMELDRIGIVLVRAGELERFAPTLGVAKGPEWLTAALTSGAHKEQAVREHIRRCLSSIDTPSVQSGIVSS